ncbi:hypothetical protein JQM83_05180 [Parabacteroides distasonis]|nr:hypothetical protein [Parabacteroides distasonis]
MNKNNVALLQEAGYKYILEALIKSESASVKQWILSLEKADKACYDYKRENRERLIVSYSDNRAKKIARKWFFLYKRTLPGREAPCCKATF